MFVSDISERSDAYAAGVRQYDIIVSFNGVTIEDPAHFMRMLADSPIGGTVTLGLLRTGRSLSAKVPIVQTSGRGPAAADDDAARKRIDASKPAS